MVTRAGLGAILAILPLSFATNADAHEYTVGTIAIEHPWARATPAAAPVAGGYLTLRNMGTVPDRLISGSSPIAEKLEIHTFSVSDGIAKMRPLVEGVEILPGQTITLSARGTHMMFVRPKIQLVEGRPISATLTFEKAGDITVDFAVQGLGPAKALEAHDRHPSQATP